MIPKYLGFMLICSISGIGYFKYNQYKRINQNIKQLYKEGKLEKHLFDIDQQSSYSIDTTMDSFQMSYNQFNINNYRANLAKQCNGNILETCAGSNRNLKFFKPTNTLTLIDWSPFMASIGMTKSVPATSYKYVVGDVTKMPFNDNQFDSVIDTFGLQYVINPSKALQQMRRVCKKDGRIILMNQGLSKYVELHFWERVKWGYNLMRGGYFSNRNWQKIINDFDFQIEYKDRRKNGKIYIFVLRNKKDETKSEQISKGVDKMPLVQ